MRKLNKNSPGPHRCAAEDRAKVETTMSMAKRFLFTYDMNCRPI
jgi:hypothetical protein